MASDLAALLALQQLRTRRAQGVLADAQARWRAAQDGLDAAIRRFKDREEAQCDERDARIRDILAAPASVASLARIRLQYDIDEDELAVLGRALLNARKDVARCLGEVAAAKAEADRQTKRETKLIEASARVSQGLARQRDVRAEMELER
jgi:hypothetical protein